MRLSCIRQKRSKGSTFLNLEHAIRHFDKALRVYRSSSIPASVTLLSDASKREEGGGGGGGGVSGGLGG